MTSPSSSSRVTSAPNDMRELWGKRSVSTTSTVSRASVLGVSAWTEFVTLLPAQYRRSMPEIGEHELRLRLVAGTLPQRLVSVFVVSA